MGGGRRRQLEILRRLAAETELTLASVCFGAEDERLLAEIAPAGVQILTGRPFRGLTRNLPLALQWSWSAELAGKIRAAHSSKPFQLAVISHTYAFHYAPGVGSIPRVVDAQNVESRVYAQYSRLPRPEQAKIRRLAGISGKGFLGAGYSASRIALLEHDVWRRAELVICVSVEEQEEIAAVAPETRTIFAPNCPSIPARPDLPEVGRGGSQISFTGSLNYLPNIDAVVCLAEQVAPRLRLLVPDVRIVVAGAQPSRRLVEFATDHDLEVVPNPPDMAEVTAGTVMVCPVRLIAGTRLKILDARDMGLPVVTTSLAAEGIDVQNDPGVLVRNDPDGMAEGAAQFLRASTWPPARKSPTWEESLSPVLRAVEAMIG